MHFKFTKILYAGAVCLIVSVVMLLKQTKTVIKKDPNTKYILEWKPRIYFLKYMHMYNRRSCSFQNCYITSNKRLLEHITDFDAILFHAKQIIKLHPKFNFPKERSSYQSYIFHSMESSHNYYINDDRYNNIFNFTMTYKLNSDVKFIYMVAKNRDGQIIGPDINVPWLSLNEMSPITDEIKGKLKKKRKAAAWMASNCHTLSKREKVVEMLIKQLEKHNMSVDIYGKCGDKVCPRSSNRKCAKKIQDEYYFYLSFENSISDDYVTEKLFMALENYAVPIVYGGADYTRFMPEGAYLDVRKLPIKEIANRMAEAVRDINVYYNYFKWHNHYYYADYQLESYCLLCDFLNKVDPNQVSVVANFFEWWRPAEIMEIVERSFKDLNSN